jgi:hypothetical protein
MNKSSPRRARSVPYYRATFSLPAQLAKDIARLSKRLGVSQSAFLSELLKDPIAAMLDIIDELPQAGATPDDLKRAKGKSKVYIEQIVQEATSLAVQEALK